MENIFGLATSRSFSSKVISSVYLTKEIDRETRVETCFVWFGPGTCCFWMMPVSFAQATHRVPQDFGTIQLAVDNANAGDTIRIGPGKWCGASITKTLNLVGEGATSSWGALPGSPGPVGDALRRGFFVNAAASGTSISHFIFDASVSLTPIEIPSRLASVQRSCNNVVVDSNRFLGGAAGIQANGSGWLVIHNVLTALRS